MTSTNGSPTPQNHGRAEQAEMIARMQQKVRARRLAAAKKLATRIQIGPDGSRTFIRFTTGQRLEHQLLIITFTLLAITGLLQRYSDLAPVSWSINTLFGGVETLRTLHHLGAIIFIIQSFYHMVLILIVWFVERKWGSMWPRVQDFRNLVEMLKYNLGRINKKPAFDRFSVEEKVEYWALLWGTVVMILTGFIQWFPAQITLALPGSTVPISRAIHSWEAILAVLSILIWHMYHTVIKEKNTSIFTGTMTEEEMREAHPLEYRRIVAAYNYLLKHLAEEKVAPAPPAVREAPPAGQKSPTTVQETPSPDGKIAEVRSEAVPESDEVR